MKDKLGRMVRDGVVGVAEAESASSSLEPISEEDLYDASPPHNSMAVDVSEDSAFEGAELTI